MQDQSPNASYGRNHETSGSSQVYRTCVIHRERLKKNGKGDCTLASCSKRGSQQLESHYEVESELILKSKSEPELETTKESCSDNQVLSWIRTKRANLGLVSKLEQYVHQVDEATDITTRESILAVVGPIAGVKDLKLLSQHLSNIRVQEPPIDAEFVYALRVDQDVLNAKYNPYHLRIVSSDIAHTHDVHYTISAYYVTKVNQQAFGFSAKYSVFTDSLVIFGVTFLCLGAEGWQDAANTHPAMALGEAYLLPSTRQCLLCPV